MSSESSSNNADWPYKVPLQPDYSHSTRLIGGRYELLELAGRGGTSRIYRALDRRLERIVAVKLLLEENNRDASSVARFNREARSLAALSSPYIVNVFDYGEEEDSYYIVMEYIDGINLKELIRNNGPFQPEEAIVYINQVLLALGTAHSHGIIHRDVKPQNILVQSGTDLVKLTDFGVARAPDNITITTLGTTIGTVQYMAPEQSSGGVISPASDLYAVGVVLYEMLAGRLPFEGNNQMQIALQHLHDPPPPLSSLGLHLPPSLEQVVMRALAKNPAQRYQTAEEMRQALLRVYDQLLAPPPGNSRSSRPYYAGELRPGTVPAMAGATREYRRPVRVQERSSTGWILPLVIVLLLLAGGLVAWLAYSAFGGRSPAAQQSSPVASMTSGATANTVETPVSTSQAAAPIPTSAPTVAPTVAPTATIAPLPTATAPPTATDAPPAPTPTVAATAPSTPGTVLSLRPDQLGGAYQRNDRTLYGRPEVALYGSGSNYDQGNVTFALNSLPAGNTSLRITGLDDERPAQCGFQVILNGVTLFDGANSFPRVPDGDNGEGGSDRYWGQMQIQIPPGVLRKGDNNLVVRNTTNWLGYLGIPYILISSVDLVTG